jgi:endonuclease-3
LWVDKIMSYISSIGFYRNKAKFIYQTGIILQEKYHSIVPCTMNDLISLPWVWIKTAKVILSNLYYQPYIAVDTHVHRVANRLWFVHTKTPEETDQKLELRFDDSEKISLHHRMVLFGRYKCKSRKPDCPNCWIQEVCEYFQWKK